MCIEDNLVLKRTPRKLCIFIYSFCDDSMVSLHIFKYLYIHVCRQDSMSTVRVNAVVAGHVLVCY